LWPKSISISFSNSAKSKSAQKHTVSHVTKVEEDISPTGQIVFPNGAKTLETRNQEMSDKSINE
jgi:hypothetical protein